MMNQPHGIAPILAGPHTRNAGSGGTKQSAPRSAPATMTVEEILAHPAMVTSLRGQAEALLTVHKASPRTLSPFAGEARWLMAQLALATYFRNEARKPGAGLMPERFVDQAVEHDLASRTLAAGFINEMLKYGVMRRVPASEGKRARPIEPSSTMLTMVSQWLAVHLATLDALDGGTRAAAFHARPALLGAIQPLVADGLLASRARREPNETVALFTSINDGGIVIERLLAGCQEADADQIPTGVMSISALSRGLNVSAVHLGRKLSTATARGGLGWSGPFGRSVLWMSTGFWREYHAAQAAKLAIMDAAFAAAGTAPNAHDPERKAAAS